MCGDLLGRWWIGCPPPARQRRVTTLGRGRWSPLSGAWKGLGRELAAGHDGGPGDAGQLVAQGGCRVLLLEGGHSNRHPLLDMPPGIFKMINGSKFMEYHTTVPQPHLNGRAHDIPQGNVLGGGSTVNGADEVHVLDCHFIKIDEGWYLFDDIFQLFY